MMVTNAINVKEVCANDMGDCGISLDGSWQKRDTSHNGVVTRHGEMFGCGDRVR